MKRITVYFISLLLLMTFLNGCSQDDDSRTDLFQYKNSYVGDSSAVGNIVKQLAHSEELNQISLETQNEPYGITLEYKDIDAERLDDEMQETVIANSTFLFALIKNVDWIIFKFPDQEFSVTKEKVEDWYNTNLDAIDNEQDLKSLIQKQLNAEESVHPLFS
ncbi:DUF4825 domain-containing protein [Marinicrinis lubricantis]|uniref:DUF4825 domain-containing protein n=1 Tax=Marinicrinis lubricantis TaxID=2086470 RepID=A0ABW1IRC9_9BACL